MSAARSAGAAGLGPDAPLKIAYLTYRGKPHVGGQGVYTRHLTKALVDLGHTVEVFGGQPYPVLDERIPLHKLPSLDLWNDYYPGRFPGFWEIKSKADLAYYTARFEAEVRVNWKVFSDAFCEGYHVATIHRRSIADAFISKASPYCHLDAMRMYRHHSMVSVRGGNPEHRPSPTELLIGKFGGSSYGKAAEGGVDRLPAGLNPGRRPDWNFDIVNVFRPAAEAPVPPAVMAAHLPEPT